MVSAITFGALILLGIIASAIAFHSRKYEIDETEGFLKFYAWAVLILSIGFVVHTLGDFLGAMYNNESLAQIVESAAHVILFISFLSFANASSKILKSAKQFWFS